MVASTDIKYYVHTNTNAPQLDNVQGRMIAVLDACLVDGVGSQAVSSIAATGTTATVTFGSAHNYLQYQVIRIAGAVQTEYNGQHRILTVPSATTLTFELAAAPSSSPATGTITCDLPPLGFDLAFSGTGKRAYRSANVLLPSRPYLRVVDAVDPRYNTTYAKYAKVGIVEDMTDIDTMLGSQAPYDAAKPSKNWIGTGSGSGAINGWAKWFYATGTDENAAISKTSTPPGGSRNWIIVGSSDYFYIFTRFHTDASYSGRLVPYFFGILDAQYRATTALAAIFDPTGASTTFATFDKTALSLPEVTQQIILIRNYKNEATSVFAKTSAVAGIMRSGYTNYLKAPDADVPVFSFKVPVIEDGDIPRGVMPRYFWLGQELPYTNLLAFSDNGRMMLPVNVMAYENGQVLLDLGG